MVQLHGASALKCIAPPFMAYIILWDPVAIHEGEGVVGMPCIVACHKSSCPHIESC